ncbi:hypothetical protein NC653_032468 [Populus alba x Populus x berolinensis]|uniref:Uncharacterized protein n=1 Tax=Populus alba x Populus x berolinensis TaxID=444605 RepID=A0AAD6LRL5_9ROSI|nr:hypothetical protein NC653_032468 [Populus alba x Populus x berolinensis]
MRSGQHWSMIIKQAMEANRIELDPSGQVLEGRTIAGEISSVNHRTPCPSAPPIEGRVKSNDQKRQSKRDTDKRYNENRKQKEDEIMKEVESLEKISGELESEHKELQRQEKQWEVNVDKEYGKIVSQLEDNNAGQNTDVQGASAHADFPIANADINTTGEISMGHDGHKREMNQAPITSNAGTFSRENASMNVQLVGSSGLTDKRVKKRIADKKCREKRKGKINEAQERIRELRIKNHKLQLQNVKSKAKATQLQKQLAQYRNISALMTSKNARRNALLEQVLSDHLLNWLLDGYIASVGRHKPEIELVEPPAHDEVAAIRAAPDPELENEGQSLVDQNWDDRVQERDSVAAVQYFQLFCFLQLPANSMEAPSELVGGQAVQPSAAETKKAKRLWVSDKKYCHGKKLEVNGAQKMEDTQKQFKKLKANYAKLVKSEASSSEILDRLKNDFEKAREAKRLQEQKVEQQNLMINTLQQLLVHVLAQKNKLYIVESSCVLFIIADLNILYVIHLAMNGMKTRKREREVEDAGGIVNNEKGIPRFKTLQLASSLCDLSS